MHGGCHKPGMPVRTSEPGTGCRRDCLHRAMVGEYRQVKAAADEARKLERDYATVGYATEGAEWDADRPPLTFKDFLISRRVDTREGRE
jgi:hypothetical protein